MAKNARVFWVLPTVREEGGELDPADIAGVEVSLAIVNAPFTVIDPLVPPSTLELNVPDLEPGDWVFRLVVIDTDDQRSAPVPVPFTVADTSPPGIVTGTGVELT